MKKIFLPLLAFVFAAPLFAQYQKTDGKYTIYHAHPFEDTIKSKRQKSGDALIIHPASVTDQAGVRSISGQILDDSIDLTDASFTFNIYDSLYPTDYIFGGVDTPVFTRVTRAENIIEDDNGVTRFTIAIRGRSAELNYKGTDNAFTSGPVLQEIILKTADDNTYRAERPVFYSKTGRSESDIKNGKLNKIHDTTMHVFYVKPYTITKLEQVVDEELPYYRKGAGETRESKWNNVLGNFYAFETVDALVDYIGADEIEGTKTITGLQTEAPIGPDEDSDFCAIVVETYDGREGDGAKFYSKTKYSDITNVFAITKGNCRAEVAIKDAQALQENIGKLVDMGLRQAIEDINLYDMNSRKIGSYKKGDTIPFETLPVGIGIATNGKQSQKILNTK